MDLELSAEQEELRASLRRYLADKAPVESYVRSMLDDERGLDDAVWDGLAELGVTGLLVPPELGGAGAGMVDMGVALLELGRMVHPGPFLSSAVGAVSAVAAVATPDEQSELLPGLADGSRIGTVALLDAGARGRWQVRGVRAERAGPSWALSGTKVLVPDAAAADLVLVVAEVPEGAGLFAVPAGADRLQVTPSESVDGTRKSATVTMSATPARRLGAGDASEAIDGVVDRLLAAYAADGVGAAERALEMAVDYAKTRTQFDRPIGSFQAVAHMCADMLKALELSRSGVMYALWAADSADRAESHRAATMAKAFAGESLPEVGASAVQVFGGIGFTWEHDVQLYYKRLLSLQQVHGPVSAHLEELARIII